MSATCTRTKATTTSSSKARYPACCSFGGILSVIICVLCMLGCMAVFTRCRILCGCHVTGFCCLRMFLSLFPRIGRACMCRT